MHFRAPWSGLVATITLCVILLLALVGTVVPSGIGIFVWLMIPVFAAFAPRGYTLGEDAFRIQFIGRRKEIAYDGLRDVRVTPGVMTGSLRIFGNGGVFGFTGLFRNPKLGRYRAWVTDPALTVVLEYEDRILVLSPEHPHLFAEQLRANVGLDVPEPAPV